MKMKTHTTHRIPTLQLRWIYVLLLGLLPLMDMEAKVSKYRLEIPAPEAHFFNGFGVGVDGVGFGMKLTNARYANMEILGRVNLLEKYFPIVELGVGECSREGVEQNTIFSTRAPYYRAGMDYCLTKKRNGNRLFLGLRYGFSHFGYDYSNPDFQDPYWPGPTGTSVEDIKASAHWLEICLGIETKLWKFLRMGWSFRYKSRLAQTDCPHGEPWYVPGYGKNGGTTFGGTVNLVIELQSKAMLNHKSLGKVTIKK